jgi:hypothetical protein
LRERRFEGKTGIAGSGASCHSWIDDEIGTRRRNRLKPAGALAHSMEVGVWNPSISLHSQRI